MSSTLVLRILGPVQVTGAASRLSSQQLALMTYLACVGPASRETLIDALWGGRPVSARRFANVLADLRGVIGRRHLPPISAGHYRLVDLPTDLDLLVALAEGAGRSADGANRGAELAALESAVGLVRGPAFSTPAGRSWWWLDAHPEVVARAEAMVGQVAHRLVVLLRDGGELDRARVVCDRALSWCPLDRELVLALEGLHRAQGRPAVARRLLDAWQLHNDRLMGDDRRPGVPA